MKIFSLITVAIFVALFVQDRSSWVILDQFQPFSYNGDESCSHKKKLVKTTGLVFAYFVICM